ncbi:hypothetical protein [Ferruginibacter albus]|uniref:hypothetical protein n=1 Tax=Ferruginibacter albus TaxID=2875540 RepID=UPI001CC68729|nr:hypothetical protein [Ferruginibacter albus]UAY51912.1 hypothetical protein K9M53_15140 [Ferruginibacter albus]
MEQDQAKQEDTLIDINSMEGYDKPVRNARILLFVMAALQVFWLITIPNNIEDTAKYIIIAFNIIIAIVFVILAFWTKKKPYTAIITVLIFYTCLNVLIALQDMTALFQGWMLKILAYVLLAVALNNAKDVQKWLDSKKK